MLEVLIGSACFAICFFIALTIYQAWKGMIEMMSDAGQWP
jgi:hypothetical protein